MIILSCNNISLSFGTDIILDKISFNIQQGEHVGIVGVNGAGKSTLLKVITGMIKPDSGDTFMSKGLKLGFLQQDTGLDSTKTIWDELLSPFSHLVEMEQRIKQLEKLISLEKYEDTLSSYMREYASVSDRFSNMGGYEYNSRIKGVLKGLSFEEKDGVKEVCTLSGGQKTRLALAKLLLEEPDMLILDEPTNHLDISATEWLENFLKNYNKTVLVISHDRYFLDVVVNKIMEIENHVCNIYNGNYSCYVSRKASDRDIQQKHFELQQKEIVRLEAFIEQQKRWNRERNIAAAESRQKVIERMDKVDKPKNLPQKVRIKFRSSIISGNDILFVEDLEKEYPGKPLFKDINFNIKRNERVFLLGPNGCGKSTMLKILSGHIDKTSGNFEYGHKVVPGYYDQEQENLDPAKTILDEVLDSCDDISITEIRNALASFLFKGDEVTKTISILSGGEKSRVSLVKLMLSGSNFLLLDEPTNHLDINSREALEVALQNFDGTVLIVSHDRYLINKLATRILEMDKDRLIDFKGNYSDYSNYKDRQKKVDNDNPQERKITAAKLEHQITKEERARQHKIEKQLLNTEQEIASAEQRVKEIEALMLDEKIQVDHMELTKLHNEQTSLESQLQELYEIWEELARQSES